MGTLKVWLFLLFFTAVQTIPLQAAEFFPLTVSDLKADINTANANGENDAIILKGQEFILSAVDNDDNLEGLNGLPSILPDSGHNLTIINGSIIRDGAAS